MGRPLPGSRSCSSTRSPASAADEGEICLRLQDRPVNLMTGYLGDPERNDATHGRRLLPHR